MAADADLAERRFEPHREYLLGVARRILGSREEAEDAVQEAWLRTTRSDPAAVRDLRSWLTTVVSRICLDQLRSRAGRREDPLEGRERPDPSAGPEEQALLSEALGAALLTVLDRLNPQERVAFILHDVFGLPFSQVAEVVDRSPEAARQLASRARRRVRGQGAAGAPDPARQERLVRAFLRAAQSGDLDGLLTVLDPDVVLRSDPLAHKMGAPLELRGARALAGFVSGGAQAAEPARLGQEFGLAWAPKGRVVVAFRFQVSERGICRVDVLADGDQLRLLGAVLEGAAPL